MLGFGDSSWRCILASAQCCAYSGTFSYLDSCSQSIKSYFLKTFVSCFFFLTYYHTLRILRSLRFVFPGSWTKIRWERHPCHQRQPDCVHPLGGRLQAEQADPPALPGFPPGPCQCRQPRVAPNVWSARNSGTLPADFLGHTCHRKWTGFLKIYLKCYYLNFFP